MKSKKSLSGEKKYYLADLSFYCVQNTDNRINYGAVLENITYIYARSHDYSVSVGRIGKRECDFILRDNDMKPGLFIENDFDGMRITLPS